MSVRKRKPPRTAAAAARKPGILRDRLPAEIGNKLAPGLTVLGFVSQRTRYPVHLVWDHLSWCPLACKDLRSWRWARHEARVLRAMEHPNIVRCLGVAPPSLLLMEFLEGSLLHDLVRSRPGGRMSLPDAARIAIYLGSALHHMHGRGYLHLDIKPDNVIVTRGRPVLFDLGLALAQSHPQLERHRGTDRYMAPEQCRVGRVSTATDVYNLAMTLYEMLTGRLPFPMGTKAERFPQLRLAPAGLRRHLPRAPTELSDLIGACLSADPKNRPTLPALMGGLHGFIVSGPAMWPAGFDPRAAA